MHPTAEGDSKSEKRPKPRQDNARLSKERALSPGVHGSMNTVEGYSAMTEAVMPGEVAMVMSGDEAVDRFIKKTGIKWMPYERFKDVRFEARGGFSDVYSAYLDKWE